MTTQMNLTNKATVKEARHKNTHCKKKEKGEHSVLLILYKVENQAKLTHGDRSQMTSSLGRGGYQLERASEGSW